MFALIYNEINRKKMSSLRSSTINTLFDYAKKINNKFIDRQLGAAFIDNLKILGSFYRKFQLLKSYAST